MIGKAGSLAIEQPHHSPDLAQVMEITPVATAVPPDHLANHHIPGDHRQREAVTHRQVHQAVGVMKGPIAEASTVPPVLTIIIKGQVQRVDITV